MLRFRFFRPNDSSEHVVAANNIGEIRVRFDGVVHRVEHTIHAEGARGAPTAIGWSWEWTWNVDEQITLGLRPGPYDLFAPPDRALPPGGVPDPADAGVPDLMDGDVP